MSLSVRIEKTFPNFSLYISLSAQPGITSIFGPSGAGKTMTLDCIAGLAKPDRGRILLNEQIYFDADAQVNLPPDRRHCGYLFQDGLLFPHMTVRENLRFARRGRRDGIKELLYDFELEELANVKPPQLSGGERQRAALARALAAEPELLMLDEPSRGLDHARRSRFHHLLNKAVKSLEVPVLLVSHDLYECLQLSRYMYVMSGGRVLQDGPIADVVHRPTTIAVVDLLGLHFTFPAEILALDPGRNTSRLRVQDTEITGRYFPGHLIGDRGRLCVPKTIRVPFFGPISFNDESDARSLAHARPEDMLFLTDSPNIVADGARP